MSRRTQGTSAVTTTHYPAAPASQVVESHTLAVIVDNEPGEGPGLHRHPYSETWIVRSGQVRFTADGQDL